MNPRTQPFASLSPDAVLDAAQAAGVEVDGRLFALNSYENRVYQVGSYSHGSLVLKFYRPGRWSDEAIREEHAFGLELQRTELPVVGPLEVDGETLLRHGGWRFAIFPRSAARPAEIDVRGALPLVGRTLARMHAVGARTRFRARPRLEVDRLGWQSRTAVLASPSIDGPVRDRYALVTRQVLESVERVIAANLDPTAWIRIHGDCHLGNVLWNEQGPVFVDLDDCMTGPRVQDLWMFLSGSADEQRAQWQELLQGYEQFASFDPGELAAIEALRALRMLHHSAWIAARWDDAAFPRGFPDFGTPRYWERHIGDLTEQLELIEAPPLLVG